ncbi:MAG: T9SS type A sorting domain-containing protein [Chitinophagales bacterium]
MDRNNQTHSSSSIISIAFIIISAFAFNGNILAQGTWIPVTNIAPDGGFGGMLLLSDGTVIVKTQTGAMNGNVWNKLTPDINGSYVNGTWSTIAPMNDDRLYFSSQVLKNGQVYVAGGEYGSGYGSAEVYNPLTDVWTPVPPLAYTDSFIDANSEILPNGKVLQSLFNFSLGNRANYIYDPASNTFTSGPMCMGAKAESTWLKLPDGSILFVDLASNASERYIPASGTWVADATVPVALYDTVISETGPSVLLPDGRGFFLGATGHTAFYTPSGSASPGTWAAGPDMPDSQATPDAPAAMMVNGKVLFTTSNQPTDSNWFPSPMSFYEFNYLTNSFTRIVGPTGDDTVSAAPYITTMLDLPDGSILFGIWSNQYFVYVPDGIPLPAGKPTITNLRRVNCSTYQITGTLFNGITEGASYGDDWQMATNYPIIRLKSGTDVYYARSYNWNRTGVMTGSLPDTAMFTLPATLPMGTYTLEVVANGNPSAPTSLTTCPDYVSNISAQQNGIYAYPDPATDKATIVFDSQYGGTYKIRLLDMVGQVITEETGETGPGKNEHLLHLDGLARGMYILSFQQEGTDYKTKIVLE